MSQQQSRWAAAMDRWWDAGTRREHPDPELPKFSEATENGACPNCGSTNFTAKRSLRGKIAAGIYARKTEVHCVGCGHTFARE
jgi:hypothetical protein